MKKFTLLASLLLVFCLSSQIIFGQTKSFEKFKYISPKPGSKFINPENTIAFRHGEEFDAASVKSSLISVTGSISGEITGTFKLSTDSRTLIFYPDAPYHYKETITVTLLPGLITNTGLNMEGISFGFKVAEQDNAELLKAYYKHEQELESSLDIQQSAHQSSVSNYKKGTDDYPENLPIATITEFDNPAPGYVFCTPRPWQNAPYDPYMMILDNYSTPVFYRQGIRRANDFKPVVNNQLVYCDFDNNNTAINKYLVMDSWFNVIDTLLMGNGYVIDQHDILMRENGNHFL
ncbi:MAG: Ig-like domain-containing protein, partial [Bacteroidales bacterium]|nr:Ig-like domain-containing protein [Bacteroidales bacterium]